MTVRLTVLGGSLKDKSFLIEAKSVTLGRGPGADLEIPDPSISKVHARLEVEEGQIRILDLGSRNGIRAGGKVVNKIRMSSGTVHIGKIPVRLEFEGAASPPVAASIPEARPVDSQESTAAPPSPASTKIAMGLLLLCLAAVGVFGFKDLLFPPPENFEEFIKIADTTPLMSLTLPEDLGGGKGSFDTPYFQCQMAPDSLRVMVIRPLALGEAKIKVPLESGRFAIYTIHVHEGDTLPQITKPKPILQLDAAAKAKVLEEVRRDLAEAGRMEADTSLDGKIRRWNLLRTIQETCRTSQIFSEEAQAARKGLRLIDQELESERQLRFKDMENSLRLYQSGGARRDLNDARTKAKALLGFTGEEHELHPRINELLKFLDERAKEVKP
ncbi:MAG: FHA domain-containing protein [Planctomycetota bacterium]